MLFKKFFSCCNYKVADDIHYDDEIHDDEIHNDGKNYQICGEFAIGTKISKDLRKFPIAYVTTQFRTPDNPNSVWRQVFLCPIIVSENGNAYITGELPYSFTSNTALTIVINPDNEIVSINLKGNDLKYSVEYLSIIAVGVLK